MKIPCRVIRKCHVNYPLQHLKKQYEHKTERLPQAKLFCFVFQTRRKTIISPMITLLSLKIIIMRMNPSL